jgi:hypothetical protein
MHYEGEETVHISGEGQVFSLLAFASTKVQILTPIRGVRRW